MINTFNPEIITWARKRCGISIDELAFKLKRVPEELKTWEDGTNGLSYTTLEKLSKQFNIPIAVFFFPAPPDIEDPVSKFRRLPEHEFERLSSNTREKIRLAQSYQDSLFGFTEETKRKIHRDLNPQDYTTKKLALKVREYLKFTLSKQYKFRRTDEAFKAWRYALEKVGVFTFKDSFQDRFISGFSLIDEDYPLIMINNSTSFTRQIFTLIHELGHILFGINGVTDIDDSYIQAMNTREKSLEIKCNRFAAEVLVPTIAFKDDISIFKDLGVDIIPMLADKYSVSREVILRKLVDSNAIDQSAYNKYSEDWKKDYLRSKKDTSGGNYYLTKISYLGEGFSRLAFDRYRKGKFDKSTLAEHLNIKARNVDKFGYHLG
ncbi:MAG: ImmA/IrrE family metallo-endopeptidase [Planctomycetes bacterium]|nr:ImmA/IrrE family metallo-endopeptidase [Planctomycetota bacterium]